jgi:hypothetical protein
VVKNNTRGSDTLVLRTLKFLHDSIKARQRERKKNSDFSAENGSVVKVSNPDPSSPGRKGGSISKHARRLGKRENIITAPDGTRNHG